MHDLPGSRDELRQRILESGVLSEDELSAAEAGVSVARGSSVSYVQALVEQHRLTAYQAAVLLERRDERLGVDEYVIIDRIGKGGMGEVFKARHRRMKRVVALKILPRHSRESADLVQRFHREIEAVAALSHPNIVAAFDAGEDRGIHFLVSQYIDGTDLASLVRRNGPLAIEVAIDYLLQVARGLEFAHARGVIHRDIKPSNLLLDQEGVVRIADFGLARLQLAEPTDPTHVDITMPGDMMGTVAYMPPEQAEDTHQADARSDIYSLGCTLHYLLTGTPVYGRRTSMQTLLAHRESPVPSLRSQRPEVPAALDDIFRRMLQKSPDHRYQTVREVIAAVEELELHGTPASGASAVPAAIPRDESSLAAERPIVDTDQAQATATHLSGRSRLLTARLAPPVLSDAGPEKPAAGRTRGWRLLVWLGMPVVVIAAAVVAISGLPPSPSATGSPLPEVPVRIVTDPAGALLAVVPIDSGTREFDLSGIVHPPSPTPTELSLVPGDYLIVARLDESRFHEVFRHVPDADDTAGTFKHQKWAMVRGAAELDAIVIPPAEVTDGMARLPGSSGFLMGRPGSTELPVHTRRVPPFFLDTHEFTEGQFKALTGGRLPIDGRFQPRSDRHAITVDYDRAVAFAEKAGKRLPDEAEFEWAATRGGRTMYPWGDTWPEDTGAAPDDFPPTGEPAFDVLQLKGTAGVYGLCSNVAEWTTSGGTPYPPYQPAGPSFERNPETLRIVRGGSPATINGDWDASPASRDPRGRVALPIAEWKPGVGFRCARSAKPRWSAEDFGAPIDAGR